MLDTAPPPHTRYLLLLSYSLQGVVLPWCNDNHVEALAVSTQDEAITCASACRSFSAVEGARHRGFESTSLRLTSAIDQLKVKLSQLSQAHLQSGINFMDNCLMNSATPPQANQQGSNLHDWVGEEVANNNVVNIEWVGIMITNQPKIATGKSWPP